jgi:hypothetical protein
MRPNKTVFGIGLEWTFADAKAMVRCGVFPTKYARSPMPYEVRRGLLLWRWKVPSFGSGYSLTKGGAKRAAERHIAKNFRRYAKGTLDRPMAGRT